MKRGFTLVELLLVMGIMAVLFSIGTISFFGQQGNANVAQGVGILVADMRSQQTKAMTGTTYQGASQDGYGIHFESDTYTLFVGDTYSSSDPSNSVVELPGGTSISASTFAGNQVVFLRASGEVSGYVLGQDYVELTAGNKTTRVRVNELGVVVEGI